MNADNPGVKCVGPNVDTAADCTHWPFEMVLSAFIRVHLRIQSTLGSVSHHRILLAATGRVLRP